MWLHHELHFVHPPECGHTVYNVRVRNHDKSLANFFSCLLAAIHRYRSELTLKATRVHHKMHFVHPSGCGHALFTAGKRKEHKFKPPASEPH
jgi:hypothetical protein